jgi:hypothetical protein
VAEPWHRINRTVHDALSRVSLADLARPRGGSPLLAIEPTRAANHPNH